ncbi:MAG: coenzyme F420-0:L-glutamate ligase [Candidatus Bathyarchaeota archaeon]|uniref:coenzyme F420-0:L-glutamate ligase n=1 Tax=Candidatus Bathycorpusculum sp. TaxID=2994959 RepID=UPI00282FE005|nr:coenzyme F420-0:L-glutamate ligase [Candidatus Termiticorpusculum sp.]MCL2258033.1 coenzyme F420-0:L-glutamate ligase [Candidatus Termiticorpusculum sp.]MCL2291745.1 coenzyme F420-0:L-glutamate ligase [Candidatus Termiticorpusculum sp.]
MRTFGTQAIGIRAPIIHEGDDLPEVVVNAILEYSKESGSSICDRDIIGVTEAIVARAQGNYASIDQIAADIKNKIPSGSVGVVFPILSRNRFSILLKAIASAVDILYIQLSYPTDEVGNHIISAEQMYDLGINPYTDVFSEQEFRKHFQDLRHKFTAVDYLELYRNIGNNAKIILANDPCEILKYTKNVIAADIHTRAQTKRRLIAGGANLVLGLDDILKKSVNKSGYNEIYGLLGSNKANEERVKLFPRSCDEFVTKVQKAVYEKTGIKIEVLVYGDGAFRDPVDKIWELADPVVSPGFTEGLFGMPNELKLKYIADNEFADKRGDDAKEAIIERIRNKQKNLKGKEETEGTTPRHLVDLIGSLCDLISGSGDKGTPIILIKGYFDNYANQ